MKTILFNGENRSAFDLTRKIEIQGEGITLWEYRLIWGENEVYVFNLSQRPNQSRVLSLDDIEEWLGIPSELEDQCIIIVKDLDEIVSDNDEDKSQLRRILVVGVGVELPSEAEKRRIGESELLEITRETRDKVSAMAPHVAGVPAVVAQRDEAMKAPLEMADDMRRRWPLTVEEQKVYDLLRQMTGEDAACKLNISTASVSRYKAKICQKLLEIGIPENSIFTRRPSAGHKEVIQGQDEGTGELVKEIEPPKSDWKMFTDERETTLRQYHAATEADKVDYRANYPDIQSEYEDWMKSG